MSFLTTFSDEASKTYKDAARTATTGPINLLSAPASIGSVSLNLNDRVLVKDQANAEENGIYVFKGAGSPMVRSTDANSDREVLPNMLISVSEGDYEDKIFELTTNGPISLGVTPLSFGLAILPIDLTTDVVGVLPVANGGTNRASWTEGRVVFAGASGSALTEDSDLNWDNSNKRLGIGTITPSEKLSVNGSVKIQQNNVQTNLFLQAETPYNAQTLANFYLGAANSSAVNNGTAYRWLFGVEGVASGKALTFSSQTNTGVTERMRIDSAGALLIGTTSIGTFNSGQTKVRVVNDADPCYVDFASFWNYGQNAGSTLYLSSARGTQSSPSATLSDDIIGEIAARGYGDTAFPTGGRANIRMVATQDWTDSAHGVAITFRVTPNNSVTTSERMRISGNGDVGIGTTTPTQKLEVAGNTKTEGLLLQSRHNLTGAVTVLSNDYYVGCNSSGGAVTVALQSAATAKQGRKLVIKAESSLANVTINAAAGETIDDSASHVLNMSYESVTLVCNGANAWFIV